MFTHFVLRLYDFFFIIYSFGIVRTCVRMCVSTVYRLWFLTAYTHKWLPNSFVCPNGDDNKSFTIVHRKLQKGSRFSVYSFDGAKEEKEESHKGKKNIIRTISICCKCVLEYDITTKLNAISNKYSYTSVVYTILELNIIAIMDEM